MAEADLQAFLDGVEVTAEVFDLRPDYRALLLAVDGLEGGPTDAAAEAALCSAEAAARATVGDGSPEELAHVAAWRDAYRSLGAKPQRTRNSLEALLRRVGSGLPRIDRLTDLYNAVSVLHLLPVGGEDLGRYDGTPRLVRAAGEDLLDRLGPGARSARRLISGPHAQDEEGAD